MVIYRSNEFIKWFESEKPKIRLQIDARLLRIEIDNHLGNHKNLGGELSELKFNNGNRIYYTIKRVGEQTMFLILGGNKNGQQKDISKAKKICEKIHAEET
jgi:putative addiction module killer protein